MAAGLRARTKQFVEFGLKISFIRCNLHKNTRKSFHIELSHSTIMQCSAEVNEIQHSRGEMQLITQWYHTINVFKIVNLLLFS